MINAILDSLKSFNIEKHENGNVQGYLYSISSYNNNTLIQKIFIRGDSIEVGGTIYYVGSTQDVIEYICSFGYLWWFYQRLPGSEAVCRDYSLSCTDSDGRERSRGNLNGNQRGIRYVLCCRGPSSHDGRVPDDVSVFLWGINLV